MQERLNQYRPILAVLIVACGLMAAVTSRYDMTLFYICLGAWALLSLGCIIWMTVITRQNRRRFQTDSRPAVPHRAEFQTAVYRYHRFQTPLSL